jgi:dipeptidyl-peptidase-4
LKNNDSETQLTNDAAEEKNAMFSPDSSYIAYTKENNLYSYDFKAKKEIKLTTDGTKTTLNGYATWVYWEEIFGRPTKFRAFWWSPDSKKIAYMRFDESKTMMFPLYSSEGQHGFVEETRYPKSGDPNPEAKVGFVSPTGGKTTWAVFNEKDEQYFGWPKWLPDGSGLMLQWINRGNDNLKLYNVSPKDGSKKRHRFHYGIIGQELKQILDDMNIDFSGYQDHKINNGADRISISYHEFIAPMIKAIKELTAINIQLEQRIRNLENK